MLHGLSIGQAFYIPCGIMFVARVPREMGSTALNISSTNERCSTSCKPAVPYKTV